MAYTTVNGRMIKVFKLSDIKSLLSKKVKELLDDGYVFNIKTMRGIQSNEQCGHMDLSNDGGKSIIRVFLQSEINGLSLITEEFSDLKEDAETLWNGRGKTISRDDFFSIGKDYIWRMKDSMPFISDEQAYKDIKSIRKERFDARDFYNPIYLEPKKEFLSVIHKQNGCKTVKLSDISSIESHRSVFGWVDAYYVSFRGKKRDCVISMRCNHFREK